MVDNPPLLFTRLAIARREDDVEKYFNFKVTHRQLDLLKDKLMRKPDKASLGNIFLTTEIYESSKPNIVCVLDGGALLHQVHWEKGVKFIKIANEYIKYNASKKSQLITLLAEGFVKDGQKHYFCLGDTDNKIVEMAVSKAKSTKGTVVNTIKNLPTAKSSVFFFLIC